MGVPAFHPQGRTRPDVLTGRRAAIASLLMVPTELVFYVMAYVAGTAFQNAFELTEDESLREAGFLGVLAGVALIGLMLVPPLAGIALGERARRLGYRRLGTPAIAVNAAIAAWVLIANLVGLAVA